MKRSAIWVVALAIFAIAAAGQERYLRPVDEAKDDPSFLAFRGKLIAAAERKDAKYVLSMVDPKVQNGFGGRDGIAWFRRDWKLDRPGSEFWSKFLFVIKNGGSFIGEGDKKMSMFAAPYIYSAWPEDLDAFEHFAIVGTDVNLRKAPSRDAEVIGKLSYNIVKAEGDLRPDGTAPEWRHVKTLGGLSGYVHRDFVRSSVDYRAGFEKKRGRWVMTFFLAGD